MTYEVRLDLEDRPEHDTPGGGRVLLVHWLRLRYHLTANGQEIERVWVELGGKPEPGASWAQRRWGRVSDFMRRSFELTPAVAEWVHELARRYVPVVGDHVLVVAS
jgi:hypothetical protein